MSVVDMVLSPAAHRVPQPVDQTSSKIQNKEAQEKIEKKPEVKITRNKTATSGSRSSATDKKDKPKMVSFFGDFVIFLKTLIFAAKKPSPWPAHPLHQL